MGKRSPRLQFTDEERASPELKKPTQKADKMADKLDKAEAKIPKKTVKRKEHFVDAEGKVTTRLHFEEVEKKAPSKLSHTVTATPINTVLAMAHRNIRESEEDNVGVESAHKLEEVAEGGVRTVDSAHRSHKLKPYRNAAHAEAAADKANLKALNTTGASHVGIYVGNNMMIHCGDPIQYADITSSYWQQHFLSFGRLPRP